MWFTLGAAALVSTTVLIVPAGAADGTFTDTSAADFATGDTGGSTAVVNTSGGEVILKPQQGAEFYDDELPTGWSSAPWNTDGGSLVGAGVLTVDGARAQVDEVSGPGHVVEFVATFPVGDPFSHVGFGTTFNEAPWGMFSTGANGAQLLARTNSGDGPEQVTDLGADLLGSPHTFEVAWTADGFSYVVDGAVVASHSAVVTQELRPLVSEYNTGGGVLTVDWLRMTPFAESGTYVSRVFDAGAEAEWTATWDGQTPADTSLAVQVQTGDTAIPNDSWSGWAQVDGPDAAAGTGRYAQYRAVLEGDGVRTATLDSVTLAFTEVPQNNSPIAEDRLALTVVDRPVKVKLVATDVDGDAVTYAVIGAPEHGTLAGSGDRRTYRPAEGYTGEDTFTYRATDGTAVSNIATVTITVRPLQKAAITGLSPDVGPVGTRVKLTGSGFLGTTKVAFHGVGAPFRVQSDTVVFTKVPAGATSGRITVRNPEFSSRSSSPFTVTAP